MKNFLITILFIFTQASFAFIEIDSEAPNFEDGICEKKWETFERQPGGPAPEGCAGLHTLRAKAKEDGFVEFGGFVVESSPEVLAKRAKALFKGNKEMPKDQIPNLNKALKHPLELFLIQ